MYCDASRHDKVVAECDQGETQRSSFYYLYNGGFLTFYESDLSPSISVFS
jgi:hypothetical protein